jgi:hypothetical protein
MSGFDISLLWEATNGGLRFFQDEFPHAGTSSKELKAFSVRPEDDTPSCSVTKGRQNIYFFKDFGANGKAVHAVDYVMQRDNADFVTACKTLFIQYGIPLPGFERLKPTTFSADTQGHEPGYWHVEFLPEIKNTAEIKRLFPFVTNDVLQHYNFKEIAYYEKVGVKEKGEPYLMRTESSPEFPIFGYDMDGFVKIYQPRSPKGDKFLMKHSFIGTKPERPVYGLKQLVDKVDLPEIDRLLRHLKNARAKKEKNELKHELSELKLDTVIIATGGSDGINLASLGYNVIWFNSETEIINPDEYYLLQKNAKQIVYVADLDETGISQARYLAGKFIEIKLLWLPADMAKNGQKDFADWIRNLRREPLEKVQAIFGKMLGAALNFKFWAYSETGAVRLNEKKLLHFLRHNDFFLYVQPYLESDSGKEDDGYFLHKDKNIIKQVFPHRDMKRMVLEWLNTNYHPDEVYNKIMSSNVFSANNMKQLPFFEAESHSNGIDYQYYFFENTAVKITPEALQPVAYGKALGNVTVWKNDVIAKNFNLLPPLFEAYTDDAGRKRIKVLSTASNYMKVLINTSRIFWKKDADPLENDKNDFNINSKNLTDDENALQELHLLNKMYCVGYMLHQYKIASNSFMVLGVDFVGGESVKGSYGGTGKSFLQKGIFELLKAKNIGAKRLKEDNFPLDGVTPKTRFVLFDDLPAYQDFEFFYNMITDDFTANQKGGVKYNIPFINSPKIGGTTNFAPDLNSGSTARRLLVYHNSDYYHTKTEDNSYLFTRKISQSFGGKDIFGREYSEADYNADFNFMLQCLQFYLQCPAPVEAPIGSLLVKNNLMKIGDSYAKFFRELFNEPGMLDTWIEQAPVVAQAKEELGQKFVSAQRFSDNLMLFVSAHRELNWSIERKKRRNTAGNSVPHFYVSTTGQATLQPDDATSQQPAPPAAPAPSLFEQQQQQETKGEIETDLDF